MLAIVGILLASLVSAFGGGGGGGGGGGVGGKNVKESLLLRIDLHLSHNPASESPAPSTMAQTPP